MCIQDNLIAVLSRTVAHTEDHAEVKCFVSETGRRVPLSAPRGAYRVQSDLVHVINQRRTVSVETSWIVYTAVRSHTASCLVVITCSRVQNFG